MTATVDSEVDCAEFAHAVLDWFDGRDEPATIADTAFELLANSRRRLFIQVMRTFGETVTLPDAAEAVAARETGRSVAELSAERIARVYISLYHDHLPRLVEHGLLEYDQERDLVAPAT